MNFDAAELRVLEVLATRKTDSTKFGFLAFDGPRLAELTKLDEDEINDVVSNLEAEGLLLVDRTRYLGSTSRFDFLEIQLTPQGRKRTSAFRPPRRAKDSELQAYVLHAASVRARPNSGMRVFHLKLEDVKTDIERLGAEVEPGQIERVAKLLEQNGWIKITGIQPTMIAVTPQGLARDEERFPPFSTEQGNTPMMSHNDEHASDIKIFISHGSEDEAFASAFVSALTESININGRQIRCTSLTGYKPRYGSDVPTALRTELRNCKAVIGLMTENSTRKAFVMMELGAAWAFEKKLFAVLTPGIHFTSTGPLRDLQQLSLSIANLAGEVMQFFEDLAHTAECELHPTGKRQVAAQKFVTATVPPTASPTS